MELGGLTLTQISTLGLGAVIAIIVLRWKRDDDKNNIERLNAHIEEANKRFDSLLSIAQQTVMTLNELQGMLKQNDAIETALQRVERAIEQMRNGE